MIWTDMFIKKHCLGVKKKRVGFPLNPGYFDRYRYVMAYEWEIFGHYFRFRYRKL